MSPTICLIEGDGIGPEVVQSAEQVLRVLLPESNFIRAEAGWRTFQERGTALPSETVDAVRAADATLFGAVSSPSEAVESPIWM